MIRCTLHAPGRMSRNTSATTQQYSATAFNEPFPGFVWEGCLNPVLGCPIQDHKLTNFYKKIVPIIRKVDPTRLVFF
ncbi:hypothetical protein A4G26_07410 [Mycobacterium kansasii]|nr:hypothetical protein A4G26_07410 [Mycobacterium kansasii]